MTAMKIAIKLSDIGHCAKELSLHKKWTKRVTEEFYRQVRRNFVQEPSSLTAQSAHRFNAIDTPHPHHTTPFLTTISDYSAQNVLYLLHYIMLHRETKSGNMVLSQMDSMIEI